MKFAIAAMMMPLLAGTAMADDYTLIPMSHQIGPGSQDVTSRALVANILTRETKLYTGEVRQAAHNGQLIIRAYFTDAVMVGSAPAGPNLRYYPAFPAASDSSIAGKDYFWQLNATSGDVYFCRIAPGSADKPFFCV